MLDEELGIHYILDLCLCNPILLNNSTQVLELLKKAVIEANATLVDEIKYEFTPQGFTAVCLLAESHISIHTWPEKEYAALDIFTCGETTYPDKACEFLIRELESKKQNTTVLKSGI